MSGPMDIDNVDRNGEEKEYAGDVDEVRKVSEVFQVWHIGPLHKGLSIEGQRRGGQGRRRQEGCREGRQLLERHPGASKGTEAIGDCVEGASVSGRRRGVRSRVSGRSWRFLGALMKCGMSDDRGSGQKAN